MPEGPTRSPADLQRFLLEIVDSFEKLEVVLRLAAAPAGAAVPDAVIVQQLGLRADLAEEALVELAADGVVSGSAARGWTLDERSAWTPIAQALARLNEHDRTAVVSLMMTTSLERLRGETARAFADAFVLKRRKKEEPDG